MSPGESRPPTGWTDVRFRWWNLLLLVPLIAVVPPLFNADAPRVGGLPFFYWFQLVIIPIGIACTVTVHLTTRHVDEEDSAAGAVASEDGAERSSTISSVDGNQGRNGDAR